MNEPIKNWTTEVFQRIHANDQKIHEKMLNIPGHKGNANKNHTMILP
jgi:hypothetical protein